MESAAERPGFQQASQAEPAALSLYWLLQAQPHLTAAYGLYEQQATLGPLLREDVAARFVTVDPDSQDFPAGVARAVVGLIEQVVDARYWQQL